MHIQTRHVVAVLVSVVVCVWGAYVHVLGRALPLLMCFDDRLRLSVNPGKANEVRVGVELLQVVPGLSMVQVSHAPYTKLILCTHDAYLICILVMHTLLLCILTMRYVAHIAQLYHSVTMMQVVKGRGTSVEFYKFYADLTQQLQGLISQNALTLPPAAVAHQAALMTGQQNSQGLGVGIGVAGKLGGDKLKMHNALESVHL